MWVAFANAKSYSHFFSKKISIYAIFDDKNFNDVLTNNIVSFEQLGPGVLTTATPTLQGKGDKYLLQYRNM